MSLTLIQLALYATSVLSPQAVDYDALRGQPVALLPIINVTGEKWEEHRKNLESRLTKKLNEVFEERAFQIVKSFEIEKVISDNKIDLLDEENHRKDVLYSIGEKVQARLVAFVVLTDNSQRTKTNFFTSTPEGEVTIKYWLVDSQTKTSIFSAKSETAKARPKVIMGAKGSDQQLTAADRVIPAAFAEFLEKFDKKK